MNENIFNYSEYRFQFGAKRAFMEGGRTAWIPQQGQIENF